MNQEYNYRSVSNLSESECEELLKQKFPQKKFYIGYPENFTCEMNLYDVTQLNLETKNYSANYLEYKKYFDLAKYSSTHSLYYPDNIHEKSFEHFIASIFLKPTNNDVVIDIASECSPVQEIFNRLYNVTCYSQDIMYQEGVHDLKIGSDASKIPLPDNSIDKALLCCSIEHFENDADIKCILELERLLKKGGKAVICPLYISLAPFTITDPRFGIQGASFEDAQEIRIIHGWNNRHGRFYSAKTLFERLIKPAKHLKHTIWRIVNSHEIHDSIYIKYALVFEKQ